MEKSNFNNLDRYILTLRIIQPARIQDIIKSLSEIWDIDLDDNKKRVFRLIHDKMKADNNIISVRRGTYVLNKKGMEICSTFVEDERDIDNARLFLLKKQRKVYTKNARRFG